MCIDYIKVFAKKKIIILDSYTNNRDVRSEYSIEIWRENMCNVHKQKGKKTNNGINIMFKSSKNQNVRRKGKFMNLRILEADTTKQAGI